MKYIEKKIQEIEKSDLDMGEPFYPATGDVPNAIEYSSEVNWKDTDSISIDVAIEILQNLKNKGAERVYIYAHTDHHGYIFTGVKIIPE